MYDSIYIKLLGICFDLKTLHAKTLMLDRSIDFFI